MPVSEKHSTRAQDLAMETCRHGSSPLSNPANHREHPASTFGQRLQVRRIPEAIHGSALVFVRFPRTLCVCLLESILLFTMIELPFLTPENPIHNPLHYYKLLLNCARGHVRSLPASIFPFGRFLDFTSSSSLQRHLFPRSPSD